MWLSQRCVQGTCLSTARVIILVIEPSQLALFWELRQHGDDTDTLRMTRNGPPP